MSGGESMETKDRAAPRQEGDKAGGGGGSRRYTHPYIQKSRAHWGWDCGYDEPWEGEPDSSEQGAKGKPYRST